MFCREDTRLYKTTLSLDEAVPKQFFKSEFIRKMSAKATTTLGMPEKYNKIYVHLNNNFNYHNKFKRNCQCVVIIC